MATNNFHNNRASQVFAVTIEDEFDYENTIEYTKELLSDNADYADYEVDLEETLRSYPATSLGVITKYFDFYDNDIEIEVKPKIVSGYYEGANLDYEIELSINGEYIEDTDDILNMIEYEELFNNDEVKADIHVLADLIINKTEEVTEEVEDVFAKVSIPLVKVGQFSNGEAVYEVA